MPKTNPETKRVRLTAGRIRDITAGEKQKFLWDVEVRHLAVRITPSSNTHTRGARAFIFQAKLAGQTVRITIGATEDWGIDEARAEARRLQALIDQGIDPRQHKRERIEADQAKRAEARRKDATVAEAWAAYVAARSPRWSARHLADHEALAHPGGAKWRRGEGKTTPGPLAALMGEKLAELTPERIAAWLEKEGARRPARAALAYRVLRGFLRWCAAMPDYRGSVRLDAVGSRMAKDHVPKIKPKAGDCLQREQLPAWFAAVRNVGNPITSAYLQGLLLTGARREELAGLTWGDIDFQWRSLTIRDKVEGERVIPLTPYMAGLLAALPRRKDDKERLVPWVFSSATSANGRIQDPRLAHLRALGAAGLPHLSLHGLRRSFGTLAEWVETPVGILAQIQGHKPSAIAEKHYRRRPLDLLRMWHSKIESWMLEQAGIPQPAEGDAGLRLVKGGKNE